MTLRSHETCIQIQVNQAGPSPLSPEPNLASLVLIAASGPSHHDCSWPFHKDRRCWEVSWPGRGQRPAHLFSLAYVVRDPASGARKCLEEGVLGKENRFLAPVEPVSPTHHHAVSPPNSKDSRCLHLLQGTRGCEKQSWLVGQETAGLRVEGLSCPG